MERYIQEDTKVVQLMASSQLSELQGELSAPLQTDITSLRNTLKEKEHAEDLARIAYENSVLVYQSAQAYVGSLEDERYVQRDTYNKAIQDRNLAQTDMNSKKTVYETAKQERQDAQNALTTAQGSFDVLGAEFLSKLLEIDPSAKELQALLNDLKSSIINMGNTGVIPDNYADLVRKTQGLSITIDNCIMLKDLSNDKDGIDLLKKQYTKGIPIPDPVESGFVETKQDWKNTWRNNYTALLDVLRKLPGFYIPSSTEDIDKAQIDISFLKSFSQEKDEIENEIENMMRDKLSDISILERAFILLKGKYRGTAIFSIILAFFFDGASLLAGIFIFYVEMPKDNRNILENTA